MFVYEVYWRLNYGHSFCSRHRHSYWLHYCMRCDTHCRRSDMYGMMVAAVAVYIHNRNKPNLGSNHLSSSQRDSTSHPCSRKLFLGARVSHVVLPLTVGKSQFGSEHQYGYFVSSSQETGQEERGNLCTSFHTGRLSLSISTLSSLAKGKDFALSGDETAELSFRTDAPLSCVPALQQRQRPRTTIVLIDSSLYEQRVEGDVLPARLLISQNKRKFLFTQGCCFSFHFSCFLLTFLF